MILNFILWFGHLTQCWCHKFHGFFGLWWASMSAWTAEQFCNINEIGIEIREVIRFWLKEYYYTFRQSQWETRKISAQFLGCDEWLDEISFLLYAHFNGLINDWCMWEGYKSKVSARIVTMFPLRKDQVCNKFLEFSFFWQFTMKIM